MQNQFQSGAVQEQSLFLKMETAPGASTVLSFSLCSSILCYFTLSRRFSTSTLL